MMNYAIYLPIYYSQKILLMNQLWTMLYSKFYDITHLTQSQETTLNSTVILIPKYYLFTTDKTHVKFGVDHTVSTTTVQAHTKFQQHY